MKKREDVGTNHFKDPNAFIQCSNSMNDVYQNIDDYNPSRKRKIFVWWHDCKHHDKQKFQAIIKLLFIRCRKVNISLAFITQSYFSVPKDVRLRSMNIWLVTIYDTNQMYFKRLNLSILHWVWLWLIILKTKQIKIKHKIKSNKTNIWSTTRCIILQLLKISMDLKNCHLILCTKD